LGAPSTGDEERVPGKIDGHVGIKYTGMREVPVACRTTLSRLAMSIHADTERGRFMPISRRQFVYQMGVGGLGMTATRLLAANAVASTPATRDGPARAPVRAVLFDAFPVFDPRPVAALAEAEVPGRGAELTALWRTRQFEYSWLRVLANDYADFWQCTDDALRFAAASLNVQLSDVQHERLMNAYLALPPWPDAPAALGALRQAGVRLGFLSNFTPVMLEASLRRSGLADMFEHVLSTDRARTFKPDPRAYQLGVDTLRLPRDQIVFAAFAGWDAAGAKQFGYPTFWVNRMAAPSEELGVRPDAGGRSLADLVTFIMTPR
jgi:2-haloacid dehalogenase